jgi:nucleoside 2-deoxyribosyltransferase
VPKFNRKSVYIAGPLTAIDAKNRTDLHAFYEELAQICSQFGLEPYLPHKHSDPVAHTHFTPRRVDEIDRLAVTQAYLVIAYVGTPSIGVGIEIEMAHHASKPVVILAEHTKLVAKRVTRLVRGNPAVIAEIGFRDFEDAKIQLHEFLQKFTHTMTESDLPAPLRLLEP